jgi:uncharacterized protein YqeY
LTESELAAIVVESIAQVQAKDVRDLGRVMAAVMPKVKGRADGSLVNRLVRELLGKRS